MKRLGLVMAVLALGACTGRSALESKRQRWEVDRRALEAQLDTLEERLLTDQARVRFWQQMRERHESVSAVACANQERHAEAIAYFDDKVKRDGQARKNRVAARYVPSSKRSQ